MVRLFDSPPPAYKLHFLCTAYRYLPLHRPLLLLLLSSKAITRFANIFYLSQVIHQRCHSTTPPPTHYRCRELIDGQSLSICTASEFSFTPPPLTHPAIHPSSQPFIHTHPLLHKVLCATRGTIPPLLSPSSRSDEEQQQQQQNPPRLTD